MTGKGVATATAKIGARMAVKIVPIVGWVITAVDVAMMAKAGYDHYHESKRMRDLGLGY